MSSSIPHGSVRAINYGAAPFTGWKRATTPTGDHEPGGVIGRRLGDGDLSVVDVWVDALQPGESRDIEIRNTLAAQVAPVLSDEEVQAYLGGIPQIGGVQMELLDLSVQGRAFESHFRAFILDSVWVDLWLTTYPGQPWGKGVVSLNRCNVARPDWTTPVEEAIFLYLPGALIHVLGRGYGHQLLRRGESLADASRRSFPVTVAWPALFDRASGHAEAATVDAEGQVQVFGMQPEFGPLGAVSMTPPTEGYALRHIRENLPEAIEDLHSSDGELAAGGAYTAHGELGPTAYSGQTGAQEDQPGGL